MNGQPTPTIIDLILLRWKLVLAVLGGLVAAAAGIGIFYIVLSPPKIISTTPAQFQSSVNSTEPVTITFSKRINLKDFSAIATPPTEFTISQPSGNVIQLSPKPYFENSTQYLFTFSYQREVISTLTFTTLISQSDPLVLVETEKWQQENYPLSQYLPIKTPRYEISYLKALTIGIIKLDPALTDAEAIAIVEIIFREHDIDSGMHTIKFLPPPTVPPVSTVTVTK